MMIQRRYNLNICLAIAAAAMVIVFSLGVLQKHFGIFNAADAAAINVSKDLRSFYPLTFLMFGITSMGEETALMIVICVAYWLGYAVESIAFLLMLLFGNIINTWMKDFFELARPDESRIAWLAPAEGYGYPSGHSMTGMLYSWFIYSFANKYWFICLIAALLMAASRIYLGVHYFSDTVGGLICGFGIVVAGTGIYSHVHDMASLRESLKNSLATRVVLSFALSASYLLLAWGQSTAFKHAGLLAGFFIIYLMLGFRWRSRNIFFSIITAVIGLVVVMAIRVGLSRIFPENDLSDYCRYFILGTFLASSPLLFIKMKLLKRLEEDGQRKQDDA
jgi:membrane-associated phospholipid phosphatase